jgi:hypothetical protein
MWHVRQVQQRDRVPNDMYHAVVGATGGDFPFLAGFPSNDARTAVFTWTHRRIRCAYRDSRCRWHFSVKL